MSELTPRERDLIAEALDRYARALARQDIESIGADRGLARGDDAVIQECRKAARCWSLADRMRGAG